MTISMVLNENWEGGGLIGDVYTVRCWIGVVKMAKLGNSEGYHVKSCMLGTLQALFPFQKSFLYTKHPWMFCMSLKV